MGDPWGQSCQIQTPSVSAPTSLGNGAWLKLSWGLTATGTDNPVCAKAFSHGLAQGPRQISRDLRSAERGGQNLSDAAQRQTGGKANVPNT